MTEFEEGTLGRVVGLNMRLLPTIVLFAATVAADDENISRNLRGLSFNKLFHSVGLDSWIVGDEQEEVGEEQQHHNQHHSAAPKLWEKHKPSLPHASSNKWKLNKLDHAKYPMARCLDGSMGAFWLNQGWGSGSDKWIVHLEGGGWCTTLSECYGRAQSFQFDSLGSSLGWASEADCDAKSVWTQPCNSGGHQGFSSSDPTINPLHHNWNKVYVGYCDGASYLGSNNAPVKVPQKLVDSGNPHVDRIYLRGRYILDGVYDTLLNSYNMSAASTVAIVGSSAGGLTVYLQVDYLADKIKYYAKTKDLVYTPKIYGVPDAGYFLDTASIDGGHVLRDMMKTLYEFHDIRLTMNEDCLKQFTDENAYKCMFAQNMINFIKTPLFIMNSMVDSWQAKNIMRLSCDVTADNPRCSNREKKYLDDYRKSLLNSMKSFIIDGMNDGGCFLSACPTHSMANDDKFWLHVYINGVSMQSAMNDWEKGTTDSSHNHKYVDGVFGSGDCNT